MKEKHKKMVVIAICACVVMLIGVLGYLLGKQNGILDSAYRPDLDPHAVELTEQAGDGKPEGIRIPGYPVITIPAGQTQVTMNLKNPEGNPCYFTFELVLTGENQEEKIYTSKLVEPGKAITEVTLSRALEKGEYPAVLKITTTSLEDESPMNGANVETTLVVEE